MMLPAPMITIGRGLAGRATLSIEADLGHSVGITFYNPATLAALRDVLNSTDAATFISSATND